MKTKSTLRSFLLLAGSSLLAVSYTHAASLTWDITPGTVGAGDSAITGGGGAWVEDVTTGNWTIDGGVNNIAWVNANNDTAVFGGTGGAVIIDAAGVTVGGLQFDTTGYTVSGGTLTFGTAGSITAAADATISAAIAGSAAIAKNGVGALTLSGANTSYTGALSLNAGTVRANTSADALGGGASTLSLNGGTLVLNHSAALAFNRNTTVTADSIIQSSRNAAGAGLSYTLGTLGIGANKLTVGAGVTTSGTAGLIFGATTLTGNSTFEVINGAGSTGQLTLGAVGETGGAQNLTKQGGGVLDLSAANNYSGATIVSGGVLRLSNATSLPGGIAVAGGTSALTLNGGAIELASDDFLRNLGTGAAEAQIPGGSSGFSARGAARIVNLNNDANQITWGSATFNPTTFVLNASTANNTLDFKNPIDLGGSARTISVGANTATLSGILSNGGLIKTGAGTLALPLANSYSGGTTLDSGTVAISNATSLGAGSVSVTGSSRINSTAGNGVAITYANAIDVGAALSLQNPQTATGATATFSGQLTGSSAITIVNGGGNGFLAGLAFTNTNNTFTGDVIMPSGSATGDDRFIFNSIGDGGKFTFRKRGHQSAFIYTGASAITFGSRQIAFAADFGGGAFDGGGTTPINRFMNNATDPAHTVTFNSSIAPATVHSSSTGYLFFDGSNTGNNTFAGTIPNMSNQNLNIGKSGAGKWILSGPNTYSGNTLIANGTLSTGTMDLVANAQPLGKGTIIQLGNSSNNGTLEYTGSGDATTDKQIVVGNPGNNNQTGAGSIVNNSTTGTLSFSNPTFNSITGHTLTTRDRTLTLGGSNTGANTISGTIQDYVSGAAQVLLTKSGDGTWILSGTNSYTGATTVNGGTLRVNSPGSLHSSSTVNVNGGTLGGTGTINGSVTVAAAGSLAPGASAGTLTIGGNLNIAAPANGAGKLNFELDALANPNDKIAVTGTLTIGTNLLGFSDFVFTNLGGLQVTGGTPYKLITSSGITALNSLDPADLTGTLPGGLSGTLQLNGGDVELVVTSSGTSYASWIAGFPGVGLLNGVNDDPDFDGIDNGMEMVLGGNPATGMDTALLPTIELVTDPVSVPAIPAGNYLLFTYRRSDLSVAAGLTVDCETDTDLVGPWTPATGAPGVVIQVDDNFTFTPPAAADTDRVRVYVPRGANTKLFGRLNVVVP